MFIFNEIICETGLKPNSDNYTQLQHHERRTLWSNMKSDYESLWYTQFRKLRASKGSDLLLCNDTEFNLHRVALNTLHWQLPFHSTLVTRRPYLGHDNWRQRYRFFPIIKYHWHFDTHEKDEENVALKSDKIPSSVYCIYFAVCTLFWKEEYILIK